MGLFNVSNGVFLALEGIDMTNAIHEMVMGEKAILDIIAELKAVENDIRKTSKESEWDFNERPVYCGPTKEKNVWMSVFAYTKKTAEIVTDTERPKSYRDDVLELENLQAKWWLKFGKLNEVYARLYADIVIDDMAKKRLPTNKEGIMKEAKEMAYDNIMFGGFGRPHEYV